MADTPAAMCFEDDRLCAKLGWIGEVMCDSSTRSCDVHVRNEGET